MNSRKEGKSRDCTHALSNLHRNSFFSVATVRFVFRATLDPIFGTFTTALLDDSSEEYLNLAALVMSTVQTSLSGQTELSVSFLRFSQGSIVAWLVF